MTRSTRPRRIPPLLLIAVAATVLAACATSRYGRTYGGTRPPTFDSGAPAAQAAVPPRAHFGPGYVKDNKPSIWISDQPQVRAFYDHYSRTKTVEKALERGQRYLPTITRVFREHHLPLELAYLPMLESVFENRADSGNARGLWQFTRQTAEHVGLRVGPFVDERLNWAKSTEAAAAYLDQLGERFHYNWALALAAYNGGPGYVEDAMSSQHTWDFFRLRLRRETTEYVPRFIAMVQVAKEKYAHLLLAGR